jgi:hypothetical protein
MINRDMRHAKKQTKKVAFVSSFWHKDGGVLTDEQRIIFDALYKSARKYFLPSENVEHIFITNTTTQLEGVTNILVNSQQTSFWHICLMKILSLKFLENKKVLHNTKKNIEILNKVAQFYI